MAWQAQLAACPPELTLPSAACLLSPQAALTPLAWASVYQERAEVVEVLAAYGAHVEEALGSAQVRAALRAWPAACLGQQIRQPLLAQQLAGRRLCCLKHCVLARAAVARQTPSVTRRRACPPGAGSRRPPWPWLWTWARASTSSWASPRRQSHACCALRRARSPRCWTASWPATWPRRRRCSSWPAAGRPQAWAWQGAGLGAGARRAPGTASAWLALRSPRSASSCAHAHGCDPRHAVH